MFAPDNCPEPPQGKVLAWCQTDYCRGDWLVVGEHRKIITQYPDPFDAAWYVNHYNRQAAEREDNLRRED